MNREYDSRSTEETLRQAAYEVAVKYQKEVRQMQDADEKFVRRVRGNPRDFIFTI